MACDNGTVFVFMPDGEEWKTHSSSGSRVPLSGLSSYFLSLMLLMTTFMLESRVCRTYGGGGDHHSLLPRGPGSSLVFTSMKSECPAYARGGGGGGGPGVSNDWCIMFQNFQKIAKLKCR